MEPSTKTSKRPGEKGKTLKKPTPKQAKAIAILSENVGISLGDAMRQAGYKETTALTPQRLTESVAYKSLADRIPDDLLEKVQLEGLAATAVRFSPEGEQIDVPDFATRHKYLDTAHKLKGTYAPDKSVSVAVSLSADVTADDLMKLETIAESSLHKLDD